MFDVILPPEGRSQVKNPEAARRLIDFCDFFCDHYLLVAEVPLPVGNRILIRYSRSIPIYGQTATRVDRIRVRLGIKPFRFTLPLNLLFEAHSYHFRMPAGASRFLVDQRLFNWKTGQVITQETFGKEQSRPYLRLRHHTGLPYAHFYTRGLDAVRPHDLWTRLEFDEVPPGALGVAAIISVTCSILIWFFTLIQPGLHGGRIDSDLPALLLSLPAFAATVAGHSAERVLRSCISAYVGLAIASITSAISALVYIANANGKFLFLVGRITLFSGLFRLRDVDICWLILALLSSMTSAYLVELLRDKVRWYMRMINYWTRNQDVDQTDGPY